MAHDLEAAMVGRFTALEVLVTMALIQAVENAKNRDAALKFFEAGPKHWMEQGYLFDDVAEAMAQLTFDRVLKAVTDKTGIGPKGAEGID